MTTKPILVASHPRSGTHLLIDVLRKNFPQIGGRKFLLEPLDRLYLNLERLSSIDRNLKAETAHDILKRSEYPILKTHFTADFQSSWIEAESTRPPEAFVQLALSAKKIYILRDVRDVFASYKQFMSALDSSISQISLLDFMQQRIWTGDTRVEWWEKHIRGWAKRDDTLCISYESLTQTPEKTLNQISCFLGIDRISTSKILPDKMQSKTQSRLYRVLSRNPPSTAILPNSRKFPKARWEDALDDKMAASFKNLYDSLLSEIDGI